MKIIGKFKIVHRSGKEIKKIIRHHNVITDTGMVDVLKSMLTTNTGHPILARMAIGTGGIDHLQDRIVYNPEWLSYVDLVTPIGSQDISSLTPAYEDGVLQIVCSTTFNESDYSAAGLPLSELGLLTTASATGIKLGAATMDDSNLFAYHTFDKIVMEAGDTLDMTWVLTFARSV